ncbi:MAG: hypothetical protein IJI50_01335 [Ruminococcus sp.]|nr:hypothetical protein [Ruminococcus sp.]
MRMAGYLNRALSRFGNTVVIRRGGRAEVAKAFVQPLRRRHRLYLNEKYIPAGWFDNTYLLYIGSPDHPLDTGMRLECRGAAFSVVTAEEFAARDESVYVWAILRPDREGKEDYYDDVDGQFD